MRNQKPKVKKVEKVKKVGKVVVPENGKKTLFTANEINPKLPFFTLNLKSLG